MYRKISLLAAIIALLVIIPGAYVRLPETGLGVIAFWVLSWTYLRLTPTVKRRPSRIGPFRLVVFGMLALFLQIALGGWIGSNYAALVCHDFPLCNGQWLSDADYAGAVDLFHSLLNGDAGRLSVSTQLAAHWLYRCGAVVDVIVMGALILSAGWAGNPRPMRRAAILLGLLLLIQIGLGIFNLYYALLPLWSAVAHSTVTALMMLPLLSIYFYSRYTTATGQMKPPVVIVAEQPAGPAEIAPESLFLRLKTQLKKTRGSLGGVLSSLVAGQKPARELLEDIEASLIMADLGMETTTQIVRHLSETLEGEQLRDGEVLTQALKQNLYDMLLPCSQPLLIPKQDGPFVILVVGVNGAGKTTTIGKLAHRLQAQGHSVMLAAGDTFRAAAVEQLQTWGERNNVQVVAQHSGADSASVIFDALQSAKAKGIDVLIADTAGRLHTKSNLMDELTKIKRIMGKLDAAAPHEVLLILDAGTGQNALSQARLFNEAVQLTGLALTKLDGTAKGGVIFALASQLRVPIRFIGVGEGIEDLQDFDAASFIDALFAKD